MVVLGTPRVNELEQYYMADGNLAFKLHQAGFIPKYKDDDCLYFKRNAKLTKWLIKNNVE